MKQDDDFEIIISESPEQLKHQIADLFSRNEMLSLELENNKLKIQNYENDKFKTKKIETNEVHQMKKKITDLQNEVESYRLEVEIMNSDRADLNQQIVLMTKENEKLRNQLQSKQAVDLTESVKNQEQENSKLRTANVGLTKQIKTLSERIKTLEMKLHQSVKEINDKEKELDTIFSDIEKQKKLDMEKIEADYQKKLVQASEINANTQKKMIQQYEKRILELNGKAGQKGSAGNKSQSIEKLLLVETKRIIEKHIEDLDGRIQAIPFLESKKDAISVCKADFEEIKASLKKTIGFLEKNSI
eukprot:TRINITY_DN1424_c0_g1_i2.p1 TRINITY_DN1424_c0_g1~~TRINITY_DN1424_c0_g1_i2.p1  ORF type:complete len:302 (-),score=79.24 TRINITY_DN1424_c0_g1_i2:170-1075(-)